MDEEGDPEGGGMAGTHVVEVRVHVDVLKGEPVQEPGPLLMPERVVVQQRKRGVLSADRSRRVDVPAPRSIDTQTL